MKKDLSSSTPYFIKLINTVGKAGVNEIYSINIDNIESNNKTYQIELKSKKGEGFKYHFFDHTLDIKCSDNRDLIIKIVPKVESEGLNYYYVTRIIITYVLPDKSLFKINSYVDGWNYEDIVNFNESDYYKKTIYDKGKTLLEVISELMTSSKSFYNKNELDELTNVFDQEVENKIQKNNRNLKEAEELLNSLSEEQIHSLKKVLIKHK